MEKTIEIRKLKPEENIQRLLAHSVCFLGSPPQDKEALLKNPEEHTEGHDTSWGAYDETGRQLSQMQVIPAKILINNQPTSAGLICGVTTLPEARNGRLVRKIFEKVMPIMKEEGMVYSMLYPFSFEFYRKFGYEQGYMRPKATFPVSELARYPYPNGMKAHEKGDPCDDFNKVYEAFTRDKNLAIVRGSKEWEEILKRDPYKKREFAYIHYNAKGEPDGYILYKSEKKDLNYSLLNILELAWTGKPGLEAMLGFIHGLRSEYSDVSWPIPGGFDIFGVGVIPEPGKITYARGSLIMNRIMDVGAALSLMKAPTGSGNVSIFVTDKFIDTNTGIYVVSWEGGNLSVDKTTRPPDMELDVETLVQLNTGYLTPAQVIYRDGVAIHSKMEELSALFVKQDLYQMEYY